MKKLLHVQDRRKETKESTGYDLPLLTWFPPVEDCVKGNKSTKLAQTLISDFILYSL